MRPRPRTRPAVDPLEGRDGPADVAAATLGELVAANGTAEADTITLAAGATFTRIP